MQAAAAAADGGASPLALAGLSGQTTPCYFFGIIKAPGAALPGTAAAALKAVKVAPRRSSAAPMQPGDGMGGMQQALSLPSIVAQVCSLAGSILAFLGAPPKPGPALFCGRHCSRLQHRFATPMAALCCRQRRT